MHPFTKTKVLQAVLDMHFKQRNTMFDAQINDLLLKNYRYDIGQATAEASFFYKKKHFCFNMYSDPSTLKAVSLAHSQKPPRDVLESLDEHIESVESFNHTRSMFAAFIRRALNRVGSTGDIVELIPSMYEACVLNAIQEDNDHLEPVTLTDEEIAQFKEENKAGYALVKSEVYLNSIIEG